VKKSTHFCTSFRLIWIYWTGGPYLWAILWLTEQNIYFSSSGRRRLSFQLHEKVWP